jgi:hypothetical protein
VEHATGRCTLHSMTVRYPASRHAFLIVSTLTCAVLGSAAGTGEASTPKTLVLCTKYSGGNQFEAPQQRPKSCSFAVSNGTPGGITVRGMHWRGWGTSAATTRGTYIGNMNTRRRVAVRLSRRRACPGYGSVYTRASISGFGSGIRLLSCGAGR